MADFFTCHLFALLVAMSAPLAVRGGAPFYPFGPDEGDHVVPPALDDYAEVNLTTGFRFFEDEHFFLFVNTNGQLSFEFPNIDYTPVKLRNADQLIAPFWADHDVRRGGNITYREITNDSSILVNVTRDLQEAYPEFSMFSAEWVFIATYDNVPSFHELGGPGFDKTNSYQVVLMADGICSFVMFNYGNVEWTTGTESGGNAKGLGGVMAQAGISAGDKKRTFKVKGSGKKSIVKVEKTTNVGIPGRWIWKVSSTGEACITGCRDLPDGDYQSCWGCGVYVSCVGGRIYDNRPCPSDKTRWDDNKKTCDWQSTTCTECYD